MHRVNHPVNHPVTFQGSRLAAAWVKLTGWKVVFDGLPAKQGVLIGYPHTSNWDFITVMPAKWAMGLPIKFFAKDSLFRIPVFGRWLRAIGGVPIDRSSPKGVVGEMVSQLQAHKARDELLWLGLSPEGTRKLTDGWRSGFYQLALGADVPLGMLRIDYGRKEIRLVDFMRLSGDVAADYSQFAQAFEGVRGYHAQQMAPIRPLPPRQVSDSTSTTS
jgi:1-acyl-sn-glycerol-3-phosphate acyltransferase